MQTIQEKFDYYKGVSGDINEHMDVLNEYANRCETIIELGTRKLVSTWAFLLAKPRALICVDIVHPYEYGKEGENNLEIAEMEAWAQDIYFIFLHENDLKIDLPDADLIFFDTDHTYDQLREELRLYGPKAKKYMIFHDTEILEMTEAIYEFLADNLDWSIAEHFHNNNGLMVLEKSYYDDGMKIMEVVDEYSFA